MRDVSSDSVRITFPAFSRDELIHRLAENVETLADELPLKRAVLFGSWATGRATAYSDIDLLVIYLGSRREDAFHIVRRHVQVRGLEPHIYTEDEAESVAGILESMTRESVPIYP